MHGGGREGKDTCKTDLVVSDLVFVVSMFEEMKHCEMDWKWRRKDRQREGGRAGRQ